MAVKLEALISMARSIPSTNDSYSTWLLVTLNLNMRDCSKKSFYRPLDSISIPLPFKFKALSTCSVSDYRISSPTGELNSNKKPSNGDFIHPLGTKYVLYSISLTDQDTILYAI